MSSANPAASYAGTLIEFYQHLGNAETPVEEPEGLAKYQLNVTLPAGRMNNGDTLTSLVKLLSTFKDAAVVTLTPPLSSSFRLAYSDDSIQLNGVNINNTPDQHLAKALKPHVAAGFELELIINKGRLIEMMGLDEKLYNCLFYLFNQKLTRLFREPLLRLDQLLFERAGGPPAGDKTTVIIVSDANTHFSGELLMIIGKQALDQDPELLELLQGKSRQAPAVSSMAPAQSGATTTSNSLVGCLSFLNPKALFGSAKADSTTPAKHEPAIISPGLQEQIQNYRAAVLDSPSLVGQQFKHLTPLHFLGQWKKKDAVLEKILATHFMNICILYTANRSTFDEKTKAPVESVYNSADRTVVLNLATGPTSAISTTSLETLARWLYSRKGTDQRTVLRNIITRELPGDNPQASYESLISRMPRMLSDTFWQYQVFVDGKITKHFEELQKVIGYVADVNKKISEAIDSITKSLTDVLLATIGVLVVTVLAALVKKETSIEIFRLSMQIYSVYLIFYAAYRMVSTWDSYRLLSKEAANQLSRYQTALRVEEIADLSSPLKRRRTQFHIWFWITVGLYLGLAGLIYLAGNKGPQLLIERGIITAPVEKKPTPSPSSRNIAPKPASKQSPFTAT